ERPHVCDRGDLVGVDVVANERHRDAGVLAERLHYALPASLRTSAMQPAIAVAAAVAGLTRCVRTFGPWRFSKLRLVVDTMRSPGSPPSPLPPPPLRPPPPPPPKPP